MKKKVYLLAILAALTLVPTAYALSETFLDNFDDGNANGWWLGYSTANPSIYGNWWVEDGVLRQQKPGDGYTALVENIELTDQTVETDLKLDGFGCYGGIVLWFQDIYHRVNIRVYPATNRVYVGEIGDGVSASQYYITDLSTSTWYKLRAEVDSTSGNLDVYLDDNYLFTYTLTTPNRIGQTGVFNGNSSEGASFDNFSITGEGVLTDKRQCDNEGWQLFASPTFKNQGGCISYIRTKSK
jgi:hypothetical protein